MDAALEDALSDTRGLVFLCSGNMIRSAFAELWARHLGTPVEVLSAGTRYQNDALYPDTAAALRQRGVDAGPLAAFRPRMLDALPDRVGAGWVVLGMERHHVAAASALSPARAFLLRSALGSAGEIVDPYGTGSVAACLEEVDRCVRAVLAGLVASR